MTGPADLAGARAQVERHRAGGDPADLADALERLAVVATEDGDLGAAASALEEAAGLWARRAEPARQGYALLLAATSRRLAGDLSSAAHDLDRAAAVPGMPPGVGRALQVERSEQDLAGGRTDAALTGFTRVLDVLPDGDDGDPVIRARLLQRRAATAAAIEQWSAAATDLLDAGAIFAADGLANEAEAAVLGAAAAMGHVNPAAAEELVAAVEAVPPRDGATAARRGLVGGQVAMRAGNPARALDRFDAAGLAALDAADPVAYLAAMVEASRAATATAAPAAAYGRLATAWATLGDLLGAEAARSLARPAMEEFRRRLGAEEFDVARAAYEAERRSG